ncbi:SAM-dependent methyltransferase [Nocardia sp. NEAU-G5]|uniref:SAM-dependent methyltransferase n=1 Tax=Nocardia albiluteola TaxID=2842303 RepID=A0ABS6AQL8_9NOCA|nr:SAM-dependent methyltransferase [Nocardia albiluteola]MBU3060288.1 SAM-dependent methyltransferase [Nocardia albiluteola]
MSTERKTEFRTDIPHSARIWNYWMGGKDNYEIDQVVGDASLEIDPDIATMAIESRKFLIRAVTHLAREAGITQFLDIGTGLPTMRNTHEAAQEVVPEAKIVYVDNDPLVLVHARALLISATDEGVAEYVEADYHEPEKIIAAAREVLDFDLPIAVMFMGVLGHARSYDDLLRIVHTMLAAAPSGSYLVYWDGTDDSEAYVTLCEEYTKSGGVPYVPRTQRELSAVFEGLELLDPGFGPMAEWGIPAGQLDRVPKIAAYGGVARKP